MRGSVVYYVLLGVSYLLGLYIYGIKFPECCKPGKFDIWVLPIFSLVRINYGTFL